MGNLNHNSKEFQEMLNQTRERMQQINESEHVMSIYIITNSIDDKVYIGKTEQKDMQEVLQQHKSKSKKENKDLSKLHQHMKELGPDQFIIQIVDQYVYKYQDQKTKKDYFKSFLEKYVNEENKDRLLNANIHSFNENDSNKKKQKYNKDKKKAYYQNKKESIIKKCKEYRDANKEKIYQQKKEYRKKNNDRYACKICNNYSTFSLYSYKKHLQRKDHQKQQKQQEQQEQLEQLQNEQNAVEN